MGWLDHRIPSLFLALDSKDNKETNFRHLNRDLNHPCQFLPCFEVVHRHNQY